MKTDLKTEPKRKAGRLKKFTPAQFSALIDAYIKKIGEEGKVATITGFCIFAGCNKDLVADYEKNSRYTRAVKKLRLYCENALVDKVINDNKPVGGIFLLKALYNYQDTNKIDITSNGNTLGVVQLPSKSPQK